jgi:ssDNA-binding Zn-finger/Zn-ribbon topoisomerase 1
MAAVSRKPCARCGKPLSIKRERYKYCYLCDLAVKRDQKQAAHDKRVEKLYGLKPGEYRKLYEAQGGRCAIAKCRARGLTLSLAVDHDHKLGLANRKAVRGLLCKRHNREIGYANDDPEVFDSLANYLRNPPAYEVLT